MKRRTRKHKTPIAFCRTCFARLDIVMFRSEPRHRPCEPGTRKVHHCYVESGEFRDE